MFDELDEIVGTFMNDCIQICKDLMDLQNKIHEIQGREINDNGKENNN